MPLTGMRQKVGNYPGVTVERKEGTATGQHGESFRIIDLPGSYSLNVRSPDEAVLRDVLLGRRADTPKLDAVNLRHRRQQPRAQPLPRDPDSRTRSAHDHRP